MPYKIKFQIPPGMLSENSEKMRRNITKIENGMRKTELEPVLVLDKQFFNEKDIFFKEKILKRIETGKVKADIKILNLNVAYVCRCGKQGTELYQCGKGE